MTNKPKYIWERKESCQIGDLIFLSPSFACGAFLVIGFEKSKSDGVKSSVILFDLRYRNKIKMTSLDFWYAELQ